MLSFASVSEQSPTENSLKTGSPNDNYYIELGLVLDNDLYHKFDQDDEQVKQYSLNLVKEANAFLRPINVSIILVDVIIWKDQNEIPIINDTFATLTSLKNFASNVLATKTNLDSVILLSGSCDLHQSSTSYLRSMCKQTPNAVVIRIDTVHSKQNAAVVVHELGHVLGAGHHIKCHIMSPFRVDWNDPRWSQGSVQDLVKWREAGLWKCLGNKPSKVYGEIEDQSE